MTTDGGGAIHVMCDLETMGAGPRAAVCAIAAAPFEPWGEAPDLDQIRRRGFSRSIDLDSALARGMEIDGETVAWWLAQEDAARRALIEEPIDLAVAMREFADWLQALAGNTAASQRLVLWAKPASFDLVIAREALARSGVKCPWNWRKERCLLSIKRLFEEAGEMSGTPPLWPSYDACEGTTHVALDDVYSQILDARAVCAALV